MWKFKMWTRRGPQQKLVQTSGTTRQRARLVLYLMLLGIGLLLLPGCRRDMQDQPKMKPYRASTFFGDSLSARQPVPGTVPRGYLKTDSEFFTGKKRTSGVTAASPSQTPAGPQPQSASQSAGATSAASYPDAVDTFPFAIDDRVLIRGRERYEIFCSVCHGMTGFGDGMVVRRGFRRAISFHDDRLRQAPVGHFFDAITNGWGVMPSYAAQIPAQDRWAIIAYIRALQLSQQERTNVPASQPAASPAPNGGHQ